MTFELPSRRQLRFVGITVQDGGVLNLQTYDSDIDDKWYLQVSPEYR